LGLAGLIIVMAVSQLMTFDKFVPIVQNYELPGGSPSGRIGAALLSVGEVVCLPFLLRMKVSRLFRLVSALSLLAVGGGWLALGMWAAMTRPPLIGLGLFGSLIKQGSPALLSIYGLGLLALSTVIIWRSRRDFLR
jgi:hypothetical protein